MNTINRSINTGTQFTALTSIKYGGKFNPDKELLHAKAINSLVNTEHLKDLFKKYDVEAKFRATAAEKNKKAKASLDLYLSQIPTNFLERLKDLLGWNKFRAHINITKTHSSDYNEAVKSLTKEFGSSLTQKADALFNEEKERKVLMNQLQNKLSIHSESEIFY